MWRKILLLCLSGLASLIGVENLQAQRRQIKFDRIGLEQGFLQSAVTCILQDHKGLMWFGTEDGLNKYDGYRFGIYKHKTAETNSLSDNHIRALYEDNDGALWIGTFGGGLDKFDRDLWQYTHFVNDPKNPHSLSDNRVFAICESRYGRDRGAGLWIGTGNGLNILDRAAGKFTRVSIDPNNPDSLSDHINCIYEDRLGALWIGTDGGLARLNRDERAAKQFTRFVSDSTNLRSLSHNHVTAIYEDHAGVLWIGTSGGLNKLDRASGEFTRLVNDPNDPNSLSANDVRCLYEDPRAPGMLWIGTEGGGLNFFEPDSLAIKTNRNSGLFTRLVNDPYDPHSLSENRVRVIYQNPLGGTLWIGTYGGRLNKLARGRERFAHFINDPSDPHSLSHNRVWSIHEDSASRNTLWIGTQNGLNRLDTPADSPAMEFDRKAERFTRFVNDPKNPRSLSHNVVRAIYEDHTGALWIGTEGGLNRFDQKRKRFTRFLNDPENPSSLGHNRVQVICEDSRRTGLWIGTYGGGLNKLVLSEGEGSDRAKEQFIRFVNDPQNPQSLSHNRVWSIYEDHAGTLWIGTSGGLNKFDRDKNEFTRFVHDPNNPNSLSHNAVFAIYEDSHRAGLWIGTYGGGLNKLVLSPAASGAEGSDRTMEQFTRYTAKDGLANDEVYGILEDDHGYLWLSTSHGLSRFDPQTKIFKNYDEAAGLQSNEFNAGAYFKSKRGEMFFGGINGFNVFDPNRLEENSAAPPVVITDFKIFDESVNLGRAIYNVEALTLAYRDNFFAFEFAALSYANPQKNQYAYKLEGFDPDWIYCQDRRYASYTNLDPGQYVFRVKGSNDGGVWNEAGTSIAITITPPWWRTRWAYMFYALALIGGVVAADRIQRRRVIVKERAQAQIREAELRAQTAEAQAQALQAENERKKNIEWLSEIGKEITASLDFETIFYKLYERANQLADAAIFGVGIYHPEQEQIEYHLAIYKGKRYAPYTRDTRDKNQFPVWCLEHRQPVLIGDVRREYSRYISAYQDAGRLLEDGTRSAEPQSLIYLPLLSQEKVLGVITIQSFEKNAYTDHHLNLLQNLAAYTSIALDNADAYRRLDATLQNLQATQQQLVTQQKLASLGALTAGIAHEIKNPLNFVNNFAVLSIDLANELEAELKGETLAPEKREMIENILYNLRLNATKINEHGKRADGIVKSMMQHARGSSGQRELADINHLLDEAVNLVYHGLRANDVSFNVTIEKEYDEAIGKLSVVPQDISRVFLNIVNNACYAAFQKQKANGKEQTAKGHNFSPTLSVSTKNLGDKIEIRIRDNGNGIPAEVRDKIFNPFFTTKPTGQGTGLGLSISYDIIVQEHRGEIKVETEEGKFTEFVVRLPRMV